MYEFQNKYYVDSEGFVWKSIQVLPYKNIIFETTVLKKN